MLQPGTLLQGRYRIVRPLGRGGLAQTFEVDDGGTVKVLKVLLPKNHPKAVCLFKREADVLSKLNHPGIPRVDLDGYFCFQSEENSELFHCLVMEKIPGSDLEKWLSDSDNQPITQTQAINWLRQLLEILKRIHQQNVFHRDIKPSNIMLKPNGQLVLIDFGSVRELTETYWHKRQSNLTGTRGFYTPRYAPLEQVDGKAVPQSDFFAIGRSFVYLLTGKSLLKFSSDSETGQLIWRNDAPQISESLADLIDWLMKPFPGQRPQTAQEILQALAIIEGADATSSLATYQGTTKSPPDRSEAQDETSITQKNKPLWRRLSRVLLTSVVVTSGLMGARSLSWLQSWELKAFDQMMQLRPQLRPAEKPDPRLLIVKFTEEDIKNLGNEFPMHDRTMLQLLKKLEVHQPRVIGLDIYRDRKEGEGHAELMKYLKESDRVISVCTYPSDEKPKGTAPPAGLADEQLGFDDVTSDPDKIVRRHLLAMKPEAGQPCSTFYALSFQMALHYLNAENISLKFDRENQWKFGAVILKKIESHTGFYHRKDSLRGFQILLNYRSNHSLNDIAQQVTLTQVMTDKIKPEWVKDKIILIGTTDPTIQDNHNTPYNQEIRGVLLQAQMVSQLVSAVKEQRPLLWFLPFWGDALWVLGWSLSLGAVIVWRCPLLWHQGLAAGVAVITLSGICFFIFWTNGGLLPLVPSALALVTTGGSLVAYRAYKAFQNQQLE